MKQLLALVLFLAAAASSCTYTIADTPELRARMGETVLEAPPLPTEEPCLWIKGNINSKGEKIYHMPGQANFERTIPEVEFCSEEEAQEAGFRKSQS